MTIKGKLKIGGDPCPVKKCKGVLLRSTQDAENVYYMCNKCKKVDARPA